VVREKREAMVYSWVHRRVYIHGYTHDVTAVQHDSIRLKATLFIDQCTDHHESLAPSGHLQSSIQHQVNYMVP